MEHRSTVYLKNLDHAKGGMDLPDIENWVDDGKVTFFVGAAISSIDADDSLSTQEALHRIRASLGALRAAFKENLLAQQYLRAFEQAYLSAKDLETSAADAVKTTTSDRLQLVREHIVSVTTLITEHFNKNGAVRSEPGKNRRHQDGEARFFFTGQTPVLQLDPESHADVFDALTALLNAAKKITQDDAETDWGKKLLKKGLYAEICAWMALHVSQEVCSDRWPVHRPMFERTRGPLEKVFGAQLGKDAISRVDLEWWSDFLWLTLRSGVRLYPTSHELSIELGVYSEKLFPPTPILSKSAEAIPDYKQLYEYISTRLKLGTNHLTDAHYVLAASLLHMTSRNSAARQRAAAIEDDPDDPVAMMSTAPATPPAAALVTTNFDFGIEEALEDILNRHRNEPLTKLVNGYRTVFPTLICKRGDETHGGLEIRWVVRDRILRSGGSGGYREFDRIILPGYKTAHERDSTKSTSDQFDSVWRQIGITKDLPADCDLLAGAPGPVIVKLHGSPMEELAETARGYEWIHFLIASEYHYVSALTNPNHANLPCFDQVLGMQGRHLVFMGYSLGDWNIRVALAQHAQKAAYSALRREHGDVPGQDGKSHAETARGLESRRLAIVKERNVSDLALFHRLDVLTTQLDISAIVSNFADIDGVGKLLPKNVREHLQR